MGEKLSESERFKMFMMINFYEMTLGFILGLITNELLYILAPFNSNEDGISSIIYTVLFGTLTVSLLLYLRIFVETLPGVREYKDREGFSHPPPIGLTFGFWVSNKQLKARSKLLQSRIFKLLKSPSAVPKKWL